MPSKRREAVCIFVSGKIYCIGGVKEGTTCNLLEIYDTQTRAWGIGVPMPYIWHWGDALEYQNKIYYFGGMWDQGNSKSMSNKIAVYDVLTDSWDISLMMPWGREYHICERKGNKVYLLGGYNTMGVGGPFGTVDVFDLDTQTWSIDGTVSPTNSQLLSAMIGDEIYYYGQDTGIFRCYNISTHTDSEVISPPVMSGRSAIAPLGKYVFCIGGNSDGNFFSTVYALNTETREWEGVTNMPTARDELSTCVLENKIYCIGGRYYINGGAEKVTDVVEIFTPDNIDIAPAYDHTITISFHDTNSAEIKAQTTAGVNSGEDYTATAPTLPGYICTGYRVDGGTLQTGSSATLTDVQADHTITFVYREDGTDSEPGGDGKCCCVPSLTIPLCECNRTFIDGISDALKSIPLHRCATK